MNESECLNADWRMVGFEDGSVGQARGHIGRYREDCAKHDVTPDLDAYNRGHAEGVIEFCVETNGFHFGHRGGTYTGVCPADLEEEFLMGYQAGRELHGAEQALQQATALIASHEKQLKSATETLAIKQELLISDESTEEQRRTLLREIDEIKEELVKLDEALHTAQHAVEDRQYELEMVRAAIGY